MAHEEPLQTGIFPACDAKCLHRFGQRTRLLRIPLQALKCPDHALAAPQPGTRFISSELSLPREPEHNHRGQDGENNFSYNRCYKVTDTETLFILQEDPVYCETDNTGQEHDKGVDHPLDQRQSNHVSIGDVTHFMPHDGLHLTPFKTLQHTGANSYQSAVPVPSRCKCVGLLRREDAHFRHTDTRLFGLSANRIDQPYLRFTAWLINDAWFHRPLHHLLRHQQ